MRGRKEREVEAEGMIGGNLLDSFPLPITAFQALSVRGGASTFPVKGKGKTEMNRREKEKAQGASFLDPFDSD